jgi:hypothetical protein
MHKNPVQKLLTHSAKGYGAAFFIIKKKAGSNSSDEVTSLA